MLHPETKLLMVLAPLGSGLGQGRDENHKKKSLEFNFQEDRHLQSLLPWVKHAQICGGPHI